MDAPWHLRLLGTFQAKQGELVLSRFATSRVAALLARLALFPERTHSREELAGLLWPDAAEDAGRLNLRVALASLRRQMEPPASHAGSLFIADRNSVRLYPDSVVSDAAQFESLLREAARTHDPARKRDTLIEALALHAGDLLPGFYDEWVLEERERLLALCEDARRQCEALSPPVSREAARPLSALPVLIPSAPAAPFSPVLSSPVLSSPVLSSPVLSSPTLLGFPGRFTRFFGRTKEQAKLAALLADPEVRLVTLLGPGGAGKTRLATEAAWSAALSSEAGFDGPVCFVPLADTGDSALLCAAVAASLRLPLSGDRSAREQVAASLASARSLVVLDNLEHLGEGGASEIRALLEAVPRLICLVTSRQTLNLEGEQDLRLAPLPVPAGDASEPPAHLSTYAGVQLFTDRAQAVRPDFQITAYNAEAVAAVCRSLEGLPLALELAAARIQALTPHQMQTQLQSRLSFLTSRRRDLPSRHRSLRAAMEWSAHLLTAEQTHFFACLSVFRGGWTADAAGAAGEVPDPLVLLEELCERSLISAEETPLGMRFRILESLREFGEEQLTGEEKTALGRRHAAFFQELAAAMDALWSSAGQKEARAVLEAEQDNVRAALSFCRADPGSSEAGLKMAGSLGNYWSLGGTLREGLGWLEGALAGPGSAGRAKALAMAGLMTFGLGDCPRSEVLLAEALSISRENEDNTVLALALRIRGNGRVAHDNLADAGRDLEEALAISRAQGDSLAAGIALNSLGVLMSEGLKDHLKARDLYEEALPLFLAAADQQRAAYTLHNLGVIAQELGDCDRAGALIRESLSLAGAMGDLWHRAYCLRSLGDVLLEQNDLSGAGSVLEEGTALCRQLGDRMTEAGTALSLARVRRREGDYPQASALAQSALRHYRAMTHGVGLTECWMNLADTAAAFEKWEEAAALLSAADAARPAPAEDSERERHARLHASACAHLSPAAFDAAWQRGRTRICDDYGLR